STGRTAPVVNDEAGEARNNTAFDTSSTSPTLPMGIFPNTLALDAGSERTSTVISVRTNVGATALTRTPCRAHSSASALVNSTTPPLLEQYDALFSPATNPIVEPILMILPPPKEIIWRPTAWQQKKSPLRLVSHTVSH